MTHSPISAYYLLGSATSIGISTLFAALWGLAGSAALVGVWRVVAGVIVLGIALYFGVSAYRFHRAAAQVGGGDDPAPQNPFTTWSYRLAVLAQIIAIPLVSRTLTTMGYSDAIMPAIAIIVGLHFLGLIPAFRSWHFAGVGAAFCILALVALLLPAHLTFDNTATPLLLRNAVVGFGCALILWTGCLPLLLSTRRDLQSVV